MRASILVAIISAAGLGAAGAALAQDANPNANTSLSGQVNMNPPGGFASSDTLGDPAKLKAGDPGVVSNQPVPDTRENRAQFGRPLSHAGRASAPTGD
jgi:hypothetical protein